MFPLKRNKIFWTVSNPYERCPLWYDSWGGCAGLKSWAKWGRRSSRRKKRRQLGLTINAKSLCVISETQFSLPTAAYSDCPREGGNFWKVRTLRSVLTKNQEKRNALSWWVSSVKTPTNVCVCLRRAEWKKTCVNFFKLSGWVSVSDVKQHWEVFIFGVCECLCGKLKDLAALRRGNYIEPGLKTSGAQEHARAHAHTHIYEQKSKQRHMNCKHTPPHFIYTAGHCTATC